MPEPVISRLPLEKLPPPFDQATRVRDLNEADVRELLLVSPVQFLVASIFAPLGRIPVDECYDFWKREALPHLADPEEGAALDEFPGYYCYFASEWVGWSVPIVLLSAAH